MRAGTEQRKAWRAGYIGKPKRRRTSCPTSSEIDFLWEEAEQGYLDATAQTRIEKEEAKQENSLTVHAANESQAESDSAARAQADKAKVERHRQESLSRRQSWLEPTNYLDIAERVANAAKDGWKRRISTPAALDFTQLFAKKAKQEGSEKHDEVLISFKYVAFNGYLDDKNEGLFQDLVTQRRGSLRSLGREYEKLHQECELNFGDEMSFLLLSNRRKGTNITDDELNERVRYLLTLRERAKEANGWVKFFPTATTNSPDSSDSEESPPPAWEPVPTFLSYDGELHSLGPERLL